MSTFKSEIQIEIINMHIDKNWSKLNTFRGSVLMHCDKQICVYTVIYLIPNNVDWVGVWLCINLMSSMCVVKTFKQPLNQTSVQTEWSKSWHKMFASFGNHNIPQVETTCSRCSCCCKIMRIFSRDKETIKWTLQQI